MGRRQTKTAIITFLLTFLITTGILVFLGFRMLSSKDKEIEKLQGQKADTEVIAFASDLKANHTIEASDLTVVFAK